MNGAIPAPTIRDILADEAAVLLAGFELKRDLIRVTPSQSLADYLTPWQVLRLFPRTRENLDRLTLAVIAGLADNNVRFVELRSSVLYLSALQRWSTHHDAFRVRYDKIASVADLVSVTDGHRQIIKFHGDFNADDSIVLDETSYFQRLDFDTPLDIKLRSDMLGSSVLFIGYSLNDLNIRLMFYRLTEMWRRSTLASARPKSYVFTNRPNPVAQEVLSHWGIEMIISEEDDPKKALTDFLQELAT